MAEVVFGDTNKAQWWLSKSKARFSGENPIALLSTSQGTRLVEHVQKIHKAHGPVRLKMRINEALLERLDESETPLTENQVLTPLGTGDWMLECDYEYTQGLEWWILGHGAAIEVLEPAQLRESISSCVRKMAQAYGHLGHSA